MSHPLHTALVVAASTNHAIGKAGQLLWHLPNDLRFFKNTTWAMPVIMGRKTYESVNKPLPGRMNIVITSNMDWKAEGVSKVSSIEQALQTAMAAQYKQVFIIGGGEIYRQSMAMADTIYMTRVHTEIDGDTFFPEINPAEWELALQQHNPADEKHIYSYSFETWHRKTNPA